MANKELIDKVWSRAKKIRGEDPSKVRQDPYGNLIRKDRFGKASPQGWEIDHIMPKSKGGSDHLRNLQAMQTDKNRDLGDTSKKRSRHSQR